MNLWCGTSGYSYKEWKGSFYPEKLAAKKMLSYYAEQLSTVEINNTFYRMPKESVLESWVEQVPDSFRFSIKASRRITHNKRLKDVEDDAEYLFRVLGALGQRLGVVLFQLPPNMKKDMGRLTTFLDLLPTGANVAFEFRHESWFEDDVTTALRERGCATVISEDDTTDTHVADTTDWGYVRLRKSEYTDKELTTWLSDFQTRDWKQAFVFFKHEDAGLGPQLARRFLKLAE